MNANRLIALTLLAIVQACAGAPEEDRWADYEYTALADNERIVREADPDDGSPGWFPERGQIRLRETMPGEVPSSMEVGLAIDGKEYRQLFDQHGQPWEPLPGSVSKAQIGDCNTFSGSNCPCFVPNVAGPADTDVFGNTVLRPGVCAFPDNFEHSYAYVKNVNGTREEITSRSGGGFSKGFDDVNFELENNPSSSFPSWMTLFQRANLPAEGPYPRGWYSGTQWGPYTIPFPTDRRFWSTQTDVVIRKGSILPGPGWYDSHFGVRLAGLTHIFFQASDSPTVTPQGINTVFNPGNELVWRPCAFCPWIRYQTISGAIVTVDQAWMATYGADSNRDEGLAEHVYCHELGHTLGMDHVSTWQGSNCMADAFDPTQNGPTALSWKPGGGESCNSSGACTDGAILLDNAAHETWPFACEDDRGEDCAGYQRPPPSTLDW